MSNILILGCGYVGSSVARRWRENGHFISATTTTPEKLPLLEKVAQQPLLLQGNDADILLSVMQNQDVVLLSVGANKQNSYQQSYLQTAKTLVSVLKQTPRIQQVIYTGTYSVYGNQNGEPVDEESPLNLVNENQKILAETEQVLLNASLNNLTENLAVCILRLGGIYGPGRELLKIYSRAFGTTRPGTGQEVTNWIHLDDIVGAIEFAQQKKLSGIYNLVNDSALTSQELLDELCRHHNKEKVSWDPSQKSPRPANVRVSNQKIKTAGYQLIHPHTKFD